MGWGRDGGGCGMCVQMCVKMCVSKWGVCGVVVVVGVGGVPMGWGRPRDRGSLG
jgi:hypothetical protein